MKRLREIINEAIGDVWRSVAKHVENIGSSRTSALAHAFRYQDLNGAAKAYNEISPHSPTLGQVDSILKNHSHYYDVHKLFHEHRAKMDKDKPKEDNTPKELKAGTMEHFVHHAFMAYHKYQEAMKEGTTPRGQLLHTEYFKHFKQILNNYGHSPKGDKATVWNDAWEAMESNKHDVIKQARELGIIHDHYFK